MVEHVTVLLCRLGGAAEVVEVENSDEGVAEALGCKVEELSYINPWSQDVTVIFDSRAERKNRRIYTERGDGMVEVCGDFIVALMPRGCSSFLPIPRMVVDRYSKYMEVVE